MLDIISFLGKDYFLIVICVLAYAVYKIISRICFMIEVLSGKSPREDDEENIKVSIGGEEEDDTSSKPRED